MGHYMTKEERIILQTLLNEKKPVSYIARKLGCCRQTVYNEIRRGQYLHNYGYYDKLRYSADKGQQIHGQGAADTRLQSDCQGQAVEDRQ